MFSLKRKRSPDPISDNHQLRKLNVKRLLVGLISLGMGCVFSFMCWFQPVHQLHRSSNWSQTSCTVLSSEVRIESQYHGQSYHPKITYSYKVAGAEYQSSGLDFSGGLDASYSDAEKIVASFPAGLNTFCYYNPNNPSESVLRRTFSPDWLFGLFSPGFVMTSIFLIVSGVGRAAAKPTHKLSYLGVSNERLRDLEPKVLKPEQPAGLLCTGAFAFAIFCGFLAAPLLLKSGRSLAKGHFDLIYLLYGCLTAGGTFYFVWKGNQFFSRAMHPPPILRLNPRLPALGQTVELKWSLSQDSRAPGFRIFLEGREEARVMTMIWTMHGNMREEKIEHRTFARLPIADLRPASDSTTGIVKFRIPEDTMHSFVGIKSKILWFLRVEGELAGVGAVQHDFKIFIRPEPGK